MNVHCPNATTSLLRGILPVVDPGAKRLFFHNTDPYLSPSAGLHPQGLRLVTELESVAESSHIRILALHQLVRVRDHANQPSIHSGVSVCFEAQIEVTWVLRIDAESVCRSGRVGIDVGRQPLLYFSQRVSTSPTQFSTNAIMKGLLPRSARDPF